MNDKTPDLKGPSIGRRCGWIILGSVIFGILMSGRTEFQSPLARSLLAGCAAAILALCISQSRKIKG